MAKIKYNGLVNILCFSVLLFSTKTIADTESKFTRSNFTHSTELSVKKKQGFITLDIPYNVLKYSKRKDFGDIRIFNSQAQQVPHSFLSKKMLEHKEQKKLNFFPIYATKKQTVNDIKIHISRDSKGRIVTIRNQNKGKKNSKKIAYVVVNKISKQYLNQIDLNWQSDSGNIHHVSLQQSDDLVNWRTLVVTVALSKLKYGKQTLINNTIKFPHTKSKYLRLDNVSGGEIFNLQRIYATYYASMNKVKIEKKIFPLKNFSIKENSAEFISTAHLPIISAELVGLQKNVLYQGMLYTRDFNSGVWQHFSAFSQYELKIDKSVLKSKRISINSQKYRQRQWLWEFSAPLPLAKEKLPQVELRWKAKQLVFLSQGSGSYYLMVGNQKASLYHNNLEYLYRTKTRSELSASQQISLSEPVVNPFLTEAKQIQPEAVQAKEFQIANEIQSKTTGQSKELQANETQSNFPLKKVVLWLVLFAGLILMLGMADRLYNQIESRKDLESQE